MPNPTIFISYSHADEVWKELVVTHLGGVATLDAWDDRRIGAGTDWRSEIESALAAASAAVLLISADFLSSEFINDVELPALFARRARQGVRVIPLVLRPCAWLIQPWLSTLQGRPKDGRPLAEVDNFQVERELAALANELHQLFKTVPRAKAEFVPLPPTLVSLARMPNTREFLFGRDEQLGQLDKAWEDPTIHVVTIVAPGGVGKSALVNHWLGQMDKDHYRGAERIWAWSFYSQGSSGLAQSAEEFFREALAEFGDPDPGAGSPFQRGERLAKLVRQARTLLILDGLEPLQHPPGLLGGKLKNAGLVALLKNLAAGNPGLCIVTTRELVAELAAREKTTATKIDLRTLGDEAGAALLRELGVHGSVKEMRQASREFGGHSLAILLLGNFLRQICDGDVRQRHKVALLEQDTEDGRHASRVLAAYGSWLGQGKELSILRLLGLFDRPAEADSLEALRAVPIIPGLTEALIPPDEANWKRALARLRELGLLAPGGGDKALDTHPLVRSYFGEQLRRNDPEAWREANLRLYEHLKSKAQHSLSRLFLERHSAESKDAENTLPTAADSLDQAVNGLRLAGAQHHLPLGLLARAALRRTQTDYPAAATDLDEALEIAESGGMRLHECDAHLEWTRLYRAEENLPSAREHLAKAAALVEATGYHRRDREIEALKRQLV